MTSTIFNKIVLALRQSVLHNSGIMVKPEVILWPDSERQWESVVHIIRNEFPELLTFGEYESAKEQGPAIWIKCMVAHLLPEADWSEDVTPIIYLPGISKSDLKNISSAGLDLQPLIEYQYTGTIFSQINGREWSILAFIENEQQGLGLKVAQDKLTRETLVKVLPTIFQDDSIKYPPVIDVDFLNSLLFPDAFPNILKWLCQGDEFLNSLPEEKREAFVNICKTRFDFEPDYKNIYAIVQKFGMQHNAWRHVWELYASSPIKYPELEGLLRTAKPEDMGIDLFAVKEESWPQVNEQKEDELRKSLLALNKLLPKEILPKLSELEKAHSIRRNWVWAELGYSPLANTLPHLIQMTEVCITAFPSSDINELKNYYTEKGFIADQSMRKAFQAVKSEKDRQTIESLISIIYKPWLESLTEKFQSRIDLNTNELLRQDLGDETEDFVLFVDAFRFELAKEFGEILRNQKYNVDILSKWSGIPSLTPTSKPLASPMVSEINLNSNCVDFRPQIKTGKELQIVLFREELNKKGYKAVTNHSQIVVGEKYWYEIGDIDTKGHEEQANIVKRIDELFHQIKEAVEIAFEKGFERIKIVTDHGWLLLPGGLPKQSLDKNLTETRWGRCALIKEGAKTNLQHLPWTWNPNIFIAYAPGISFFKKNEEYAHGGISLHECVIPVLTITKSDKSDIRAKISNIKWVGLTCKIDLSDAPDGYLADIRIKYNDPNTSIVLINKEKKIIGNKITLMVDTDAEAKSASVVLMDENGIILDKKPTLVGT